MPQICWQATANGYYWIDVELGSQPYRCMIDLGLVDPLDQLGFVVAPAFYDVLKQSGALAHFRWRYQRDSRGQLVRLEMEWERFRWLIRPTVKRLARSRRVTSGAVNQQSPAGSEWFSFTGWPAARWCGT